MSAPRRARRARLVCSPLLLCLACGAGLDEDDATPPPFFTALPNAPNSPNAPNMQPAAPGVSNGSGTTGSSTNEGTPNDPVPVANNDTTPTDNSPASNGTGGSGAMAEENPNGSGGAQMPSSDPPPEQPPPQQPPPQQPPPQQPPPPVLPGGFYLIDDFEGGRDPGWTESEVGGGAGTFTLDTSVGANGSSSSIRIDANNAFHTMLQFALPQAVRTANEVYGRVYLRLAQTPSAAHYIWVEVGTTANDGHEMRLGHNVGRLQSNHWRNGEQDIRDRDRALVANTWYCLEFFMGNNPDELRVWLDGDETALSTNNYTAGANADGNTNPVNDFIPELQAFRIGWELQNGTVWFDDVALADAQIGCD